MKHRTMLHRQIRTGQRWRRRLKTGEPLNWYEDFARRWRQMEREVIPVMQRIIQQFSESMRGFHDDIV